MRPSENTSRRIPKVRSCSLIQKTHQPKGKQQPMLLQVLGNHDYGETHGELPVDCPPGVNCFYSPLHEVCDNSAAIESILRDRQCSF